MSMTDLSCHDAVACLRRPLFIRDVRQQHFAQGSGAQDEVITTSRLILILKGEIDYTLEGRTWRLGTSTEFVIPAWSKRVWSTPVGEGCEILWCEFDDVGLPSRPNGITLRALSPSAFRLERSSLRRMLRQFKEESADFVLEGELKALLARFWKEAAPSAGAASLQAKGQNDFHPSLKQALRDLETFFCEPDALEQIYRRSGLSRNYFRRLFTETLDCPPQTFIERMRLRRARHLLSETPLSIKEVAAIVGFNNSLYFSRLYRRFWKIPPSRERSSRLKIQP